MEPSTDNLLKKCSDEICEECQLKYRLLLFCIIMLVL